MTEALLNLLILTPVGAAIMLLVGVASSWRLFVPGGTDYGLLPERWVSMAALAMFITGCWSEFGLVLGLVAALISLAVIAVTFAPTPDGLRSANWFRAKSVRESVANSRTIWDSYSYRSPPE